MSFSLAEAHFDRLLAELGGKEWLELTINATRIVRSGERYDKNLGLKMKYSVAGRDFVAVLFPTWLNHATSIEEDPISFMNIHIYDMGETNAACPLYYKTQVVNTVTEGLIPSIRLLKSGFEGCAKVCLF